MEKKFYKEIEKQMKVGTLKEFEKELRVKIHEELEKEREKSPNLNQHLYQKESDLFENIKRNSDLIFERDLSDVNERLSNLLNLYNETSSLHVKVKDVNKQIQKIKDLQDQ